MLWRNKEDEKQIIRRSRTKKLKQERQRKKIGEIQEVGINDDRTWMNDWQNEKAIGIGNENPITIFWMYERYLSSIINKEEIGLNRNTPHDTSPKS